MHPEGKIWGWSEWGATGGSICAVEALSGVYSQPGATPDSELVGLQQIPYTREMGTMWRIGVFAGKPCNSGGQKMGHFQHFGALRIMRGFSGLLR